MLNIEDAGLSEVIARVCYRLIVAEYRSNPGAWPTASEGLKAMRLAYGGIECSWLRFWLLAYEQQVAAGKTIKQARNLFIARCQAGHTWRAVAFPEYKASRRRNR